VVGKLPVSARFVPVVDGNPSPGLPAGFLGKPVVTGRTKFAGTPVNKTSRLGKLERPGTLDKGRLK
jgi:hypothetical protein